MVLSKVSARKAGISMHGGWYCSSRCLNSGAEKELAGLLPKRAWQGNEFSRMPLGLNLIRCGLLSRRQYEEAFDEQKKDGGEIGEHIVRGGFVTEKQLAVAIAAQWACPVFEVPKHFVKSKIQIPLTLTELNSAIPLHYVSASNLLLVGFLYRVRYGLLSAIEQIAQCKTQPCFVTLSDFQKAKENLVSARGNRGEAAPKEVKFEGPQSPAEMARILTSYCVDLEAEEATIKRCNEHIWARLKSDSTAADLLFKAE
jgi:hypothetical protein